MAGPDCFKCRHLSITWDKRWPYSCRGMRFKSREIPWQVVLQASGEPCLLFSPKPEPDKTEEEELE